MTSSIKPVIIIVTGAWHIPEHYAKVSNRLRHLGYIVECPLLLTNSGEIPPIKTIDDDIYQIRQLALHHLATGRNVLALMHSYGGMVGSNAFAGLSQLHRPDQAHVQNLVYMTAFIPLQGESLAGIFGGQLPPWIQVNESGILTLQNPSERFYNDLNENEANQAVSKLVVHPTKAQFDAPVSQNPSLAWQHIPVTYIFCENDQALVMPAQEMVVQRIEQQKLSTAVRRERCNAGHSPFLSQPEVIVDMVVKLIETSQ